MTILHLSKVCWQSYSCAGYVDNINVEQGMLTILQLIGYVDKLTKKEVVLIMVC